MLAGQACSTVILLPANVVFCENVGGGHVSHVAKIYVRFTRPFAQLFKALMYTWACSKSYKNGSCFQAFLQRVEIEENDTHM